ncbi:DUF1281 family ferredoxin-like fold protein [Pedobacter sp. PWIIR3]
MNIVQFIGEPVQLDKIKSLFTTLSEREQSERCGQNPDFIIDPENYFFEIRWEDENLYYETKWAPNIQDVKLIADYFQVGFTHEYEESGMEIFGQATYLKGKLTEIDLDQDDFALIEMQEDDSGYLFEGELWNSQQEVLELLLERKKSNILH